MISNTKYLIRGLDYYAIARICYHKITQNKMEIQASEYGGLEILSPDLSGISFQLHRSCVLLVLNSLDFYVRRGFDKEAPRRVIFDPEDVKNIYKALCDIVSSRSSIFFNQWKEDPPLKEFVLGDETFLTYDQGDEATILSAYLR